MTRQQTSFKYSGKNYTIGIILGEYGKYHTDPLDINALKYFKYENSLNSLYLIGELEYTDNYGALDKYIESQCAYCDVFFAKNEQKFDGSITIEEPSDTECFKHHFIIQNIQIRDRQGDLITYRVSLVSENIYKCLQNIQYSNYGKAPQPLFDIYRRCMSMANLKINQKTFDKVVSDVSLNYISQSNDNILSITKYLFDKMFYYYDKDQSLKFVQYNETNDEYNLFDIKDKSTYTGSYATELSFLKSNRELFTVETPNQLATVIKFPTTDVVKNLFARDISNYDYLNNNIFRTHIYTDQLVNYSNEKIDENLSEKIDYIKKTTYDLSPTYEHKQFGNYWNNDFSIYDGIVKSLFQNNSLIVESAGEILRKPGALNEVIIDRSNVETFYSEHLSSVKNVVRRYKGIQGTWFISKVVNRIEPLKPSFRQTLVLMRNFKPDLSKDYDE